MQRQDVHALGSRTAQAGDDVVDLAGPGQEDQYVTGALVQGPLHGGGDVGEELPRHPARPQATGAPRRRPHLLKGVEAPGHLHQRGGSVRRAVRGSARGAAQDAAQAVGVERGGHGHEGEVLAQGGARVRQEGQEQVAVQGALVDLVEDDGIDAAQLRVTLETAQEEPGGDDLDPRVRAGASLPAHRVADGAADFLSQEVGQAAGGRAGGDAPRLGDDDAARPAFLGALWGVGRDVCKDVGQKRWDERRLTGAGRGGEDQAGAGACVVGGGGSGGEELAQIGQHLDHRQIRGRGEQRPDGVGLRRQRAALRPGASHAPIVPGGGVDGADVGPGRELSSRWPPGRGGPEVQWVDRGEGRRAGAGGYRMLMRMSRACRASASFSAYSACVLTALRMPRAPPMMADPVEER